MALEAPDSNSGGHPTFLVSLKLCRALLSCLRRIGIFSPVCRFVPFCFYPIILGLHAVQNIPPSMNVAKSGARRPPRGYMEAGEAGIRSTQTAIPPPLGRCSALPTMRRRSQLSRVRQ